jgi:hypothetical protein
MSRQTLVAILYSHERRAARPSKRSRFRHGVERRAEHAIAVRGELRAMLLELPEYRRRGDRRFHRDES